MKLLSVIIPVYNVEKYIERCLDSLIVPQKQFEKLDIVVINDGTPDKSAEIAKQYEKKYPDTIRVIDQENCGHGGAWNHGTELATGKYLFYLDSDDWFDTAEFGRLIDYLESCDTDMVMINSKIYDATKDSYTDSNRHTELIADKIYDADKFDWIATGHGHNMTYAHDTIYRTSMMQKYLPLYCEKVMYDDIALQAIPIAIAENFVYTDLNVYRYYIGRPGQSMDPKVKAGRAADHESKVIAQVLGWIKQHKNIVPKGGTREAYIDDCYQFMSTCNYYELAKHPYSVAKQQLKSWDSVMRQQFSDIPANRFVYWYRLTPSFVYIYGVKTCEIIKKGIRFLKRKITKK